MQEQGPFILQGRNALSDGYYDLFPIDEYTFDTLEDALNTAEKKWQENLAAQPVDAEEIDHECDAPDTLSIVSLNGLRRQYP